MRVHYTNTLHKEVVEVTASCSADVIQTCVAYIPVQPASKAPIVNTFNSSSNFQFLIFPSSPFYYHCMWELTTNLHCEYISHTQSYTNLHRLFYNTVIQRVLLLVLYCAVHLSCLSWLVQSDRLVVCSWCKVYITPNRSKLENRLKSPTVGYTIGIRLWGQTADHKQTIIIYHRQRYRESGLLQLNYRALLVDIICDHW